jgi:hypothetical protein
VSKAASRLGRATWSKLSLTETRRQDQTRHEQQREARCRPVPTNPVISVHKHARNAGGGLRRHLRLCSMLQSLQVSREVLDFRKIEPEMAVVIVFAKDDFTLRASHGIAELISIAPLLEN